MFGSRSSASSLNIVHDRIEGHARELIQKGLQFAAKKHNACIHSSVWHKLPGDHPAQLFFSHAEIRGAAPHIQGSPVDRAGAQTLAGLFLGGSSG